MTEELKKVYLDANVNLTLIQTIQLSHSSFSQDWHLVKSNSNFSGYLEDETTLVEYQSWGFEFVLPTINSKGQNNAKFVIDATDSTILSELWNYKADPREPIILKWREYLSNSQYQQTNTIEVKLMDIEFNYNQIQGSGSNPDIVNKKFPYRRYDAQQYRGLLYV